MAYLAIKLRQQRDFNVVCKVVLLPEKRFYSPGDYIEGKLVISHRKEGLQLRGIRVALQGSSYAKFKEREQIHHKTETFLDEGVYVFGGHQLRTLTRLPPGTNSYPFQIQIPLTPQFPSSFKTSIGMVIYQVLAILDIGPQFLKKGEKTICVRGTLELGPEEPGFLFEKVESSGKYCFKTDLTSFAIGREIGFEMCTEAGGVIKAGSVSLVQKVTYYGGTVSRAWKDTYSVVGEVTNEDVGESWKGALLIGKQLASTFIGGVIEFRYLLRASIETSDGQILKVERPIKLGTLSVPEPSTPIDDQLKSLALADCSGYTRETDLQTRPASSASQPPSYSTLSIRSGSFETLPPDYDEIRENAAAESD